LSGLAKCSAFTQSTVPILANNVVFRVDYEHLILVIGSHDAEVIGLKFFLENWADSYNDLEIIENINESIYLKMEVYLH